MWQAALAVALGAAIGAILRWLLGMALNSYFPLLPLGTLAANLIGAYWIGFALAMLSGYADVNPMWRLFVVTGLLGGLTTFSAFSVDLLLLLQQQRWLLAMLSMVAHVGGSVLMTAIGFWSVALFRSA